MAHPQLGLPIPVPPPRQVPSHLSQRTVPFWAQRPPSGHPQRTHSSKSFFQFAWTKFQARVCPMTLLAMLLMLEVASCFRMRVEFRV